MASLLLQGCTGAPEKLLRQAEERFNAGDYLGALVVYEEVSEEFSGTEQAAEALYWMGLIQHLYLMNPAKGLEAFQRLSRHHPSGPRALDAYRYTASILQTLHKTRQAIEAYTHMAEISVDPKTWQEATFQIGQLYFEAGDLSQARSEWEALLERHPEGELADNALFGIANTYFVQEDCEKALRLLEQMFRRYPMSDVGADARFRAGGCMEEGGRLPEALEQYKMALQHYSNRMIVQKRIKALEGRLGMEAAP